MQHLRDWLKPSSSPEPALHVGQGTASTLPQSREAPSDTVPLDSPQPCRRNHKKHLEREDSCLKLKDQNKQIVLGFKLSLLIRSLNALTMEQNLQASQLPARSEMVRHLLTYLVPLAPYYCSPWRFKTTVYFCASENPTRSTKIVWCEKPECIQKLTSSKPHPDSQFSKSRSCTIFFFMWHTGECQSQHLGQIVVAGHGHTENHHVTSMKRRKDKKAEQVYTSAA